MVAAFAKGKAVSERTLDRDTLAAALAARGEVWVGQLRADATGHAVAVRAFAPSEGAVLLADGSILEWDAFERNSVWGSRMVVLHPRRKVIPGTEPMAAFDETPFPADPNGALLIHPDSLALLKGAVASAGENELAAFLYSDALHRALMLGAYGVGVDEALRHLAVTAARFPRSNWPLAVISLMNNSGVGGSVPPVICGGP